MRETMPRTFNELCTQLNLQHHYNSPNQLETLEQWCADNISHDRKFYGSSEERYNDYLNLAQEYLDDFVPFVARNTSLPIAQLENMTVMQYAAFRGFDHFLHQVATQVQPEQLNYPTPAGGYPAFSCITGGYYHTVNTLLNYGASPTIANGMGKFPLQCTLFMPMSVGENKEPVKAAKTQTFRLLQAKAPF